MADGTTSRQAKTAERVHDHPGRARRSKAAAAAALVAAVPVVHTAADHVLDHVLLVAIGATLVTAATWARVRVWGSPVIEFHPTAPPAIAVGVLAHPAAGFVVAGVLMLFQRETQTPRVPWYTSVLNRAAFAFPAAAAAQVWLAAAAGASSEVAGALLGAASAGVVYLLGHSAFLAAVAWLRKGVPIREGLAMVAPKEHLPLDYTVASGGSLLLVLTGVVPMYGPVFFASAAVAGTALIAVYWHVADHVRDSKQQRRDNAQLRRLVNRIGARHRSSEQLVADRIHDEVVQPLLALRWRVSLGVGETAVEGELDRAIEEARALVEVLDHEGDRGLALDARLRMRLQRAVEGSQRRWEATLHTSRELGNGVVTVPDHVEELLVQTTGDVADVAAVGDVGGTVAVSVTADVVGGEECVRLEVTVAPHHTGSADGRGHADTIAESLGHDSSDVLASPAQRLRAHTATARLEAYPTIVEAYGGDVQVNASRRQLGITVPTAPPAPRTQHRRGSQLAPPAPTSCG